MDRLKLPELDSAKYAEHSCSLSNLTCSQRLTNYLDLRWLMLHYSALLNQKQISIILHLIVFFILSMIICYYKVMELRLKFGQILDSFLKRLTTIELCK